VKIDFHPGRYSFGGALCTVLAVLCLFATPIRAQKPAGAGTKTTALPDAPQPKASGESNPVIDTTSRVVGYMTNKSIFFPDIATSAGPLTVGGKFKLFIDQSISPAYVFMASVSAAYDQARNTPEGYGQGWDAYAKRFGADMGRASSGAFFGTFVLASAFRQDPRFFPQIHPSFWGSVKYSARRLVVTRKDTGGETFNSSQLLGTAAAEALAVTYLPAAEQTAGKSAERFGTDIAWRFAGNMFKNYWPTIFHDMGLNRLKVIPDPGSPDLNGSQPRP
jgi:hypothetical protein